MIRKSLRDKIAEQLEELYPKKVEPGDFSDKSASWIEIKPKKNRILCITFDYKGNKITDIGYYKEIVKVVDQKKIF